MNRRLRVGAAVRQAAVALVLLAVSASARAQAQYDANCRPTEFSEDQQFQREICTSHVGCRLVVRVGDATCKSINFMRNIGDHISPSKPLNNDDVIEAVELDYPKTSFTRRIMEKVRNATKAVFESKPETTTFGAGGDFGYAETLPSGPGRKSGAIVYESGLKIRGQMDAQKMILQGTGQAINADGTVRVGEFRGAWLSGEGFMTERAGGKTILIEGTFDRDTPVGEVVRTFADGMSVREYWHNGKMIERGALAAIGRVPPPLPSRVAAIAPPRAPPPAPPAVRVAPPRPAPTVPARTGLTGTWRGQSSGNVVSITVRSGGIGVRPVTNNSGQGIVPLFFRAASDGTYRLSTPAGEAVVKLIGPHMIRVTNPDGWTDVFRRM